MVLDSLYLLTDSELEAVKAKAAELHTFRSGLESQKLKVDAIVADVVQVMKDQPVVPFEPVPVFGKAVGHPPGARVEFDGHLFLNSSGGWNTVPPHECVHGWTLIDDLEDTDDEDVAEAGENNEADPEPVPTD